MRGEPSILEVAELDLVLEPQRWAFAEARREAIASHWAKLRQAKPAAYNGRVLLLGRRAILRRPDGALRLEGAFFEIDYADFVAWRDFGSPDEVANCFSMAALRSADGAFLLGEMAEHTVNAGKVYFPAGTPDPDDVFAGRVDLEASAKRELLEETGVSPDEAAIAPGWTVVFLGSNIACLKTMALPLAAEAAKARIEAFLALDPKAELKRIHIVRRPEDAPERTPPEVVAYLQATFA